MSRTAVQKLVGIFLLYLSVNVEAQDVFQVPDWKNPTPEFQTARNAKESWAAISLMVGPTGKAYEAMILQSSGDKNFEQEVLQSVDAWQFAPATLDGEPIDSTFETKVHNASSSIPRNSMTASMTSKFATIYYDLLGVIEAGDRAAADRAMAKLQPGNLYEDAYLGLAQFTYAEKWGNEAEQIAGLKRAIAFEQEATYLLPPHFLSAVTALLPLQVNARDFEGALHTWDMLRNLQPDEATLAKLKPIVAQVESFRSDRQPFNVNGQLIDGSWHINLFRKEFGVVVSEGYISELKLRCERKFAVLTFDAKNSYKVPEKFGKCRLQLIGDPGTKFRVIQS
jgi:TonB family protein